MFKIDNNLILLFNNNLNIRLYKYLIIAFKYVSTLYTFYLFMILMKHFLSVYDINETLNDSGILVSQDRFA